MRLLRLTTVVAATDLDPSSHAALRTAHELATHSGAALHVIHAIAEGAREGETPRQGEPADAVRQLLEELDLPAADVGIHAIAGPPAAVIREFAERIDADVIVLGRRRAGQRHAERPFGGVAQAIVTTASAPCLVVAQPLPLPLRRVLVPIDLSDTARGALLVGLSWASALRVPATATGGTTLTVLHVDTAGGASPDEKMPAPIARELDALRGDAGSWTGVAVAGRIAQGADAADTIAAFAAGEAADLVVMGSRGASSDGTPRLGSVSAAAARQVEMPMLLVPPAVWREHARTEPGHP